MIRHLSKNKTWIIIGFMEILTGLIILQRSQLLDYRIPPVLGFFDDVPVGIAYLIVGALVVVNFIWDFYWYYIRIILIVISEMLVMFMLTSYLVNDLILGHFTYVTAYLFLFAIDIAWTAFLEPPYKLKGGHREWTVDN